MGGVPVQVITTSPVFSATPLARTVGGFTTALTEQAKLPAVCRIVIGWLKLGPVGFVHVTVIAPVRVVVVLAMPKLSGRVPTPPPLAVIEGALTLGLPPQPRLTVWSRPSRKIPH